MLVVMEALSTKALACMKKLQALDLSTIAACVMNPQNGYGWTRQQAFRAIERYKAFLFISYLYPQTVLVPTQEIDRVWHCHILHTRKYRQDCEMLFGYFIDHEPESEVWGECDGQNLDAMFVRTQALLALFEAYFQTDSLGESVLSGDSAIAKNQVEMENLHLYRSACGRPQCFIS